MKSSLSMHKLTAMAIFLLCTATINARDRAHFYSTFPIWQEPRLEQNWLMSLDAWIYTGKASSAHNKDHCCTPLLDIYGTYNMRALGENVPGKDLSSFPDLIMTLLSQIPACSNSTFATLSVSGCFRDTGANLMLTQNFTHGLFATIDMPIRSLSINNIKRTDLSPTAPATPNVDNPIWQSFLTLLDSHDIYKKHGLTVDPCWKKTGIGDISLMLGWTCNDQDTEHLDFVDYTFQGGILCPSGAQRNPDIPFSLPLGYDGHVGMPLIGDVGLGLYDWLTFCLHLDTVILFNATKELRMKTSPAQSGMIKLAKGTAKINPGFVVNLGGLIKADHVYKGLSVGLGYTFSHKNADTICPCDTTVFNSFIASNDEMYKEWSMHTIHLQADYDLNQEDWVAGPRIGLFCNWYVGGKRTFKTHSYGGSLGLDVNFDF